MDTRKLCQSCGASLAADAPRGLCPACLLKVAMDPGSVAGDDPPGFAPPPVGELAAKFPQLELIRFIGRGGMGAVYQARQKELDRLVALKILPLNASQPAAFAERFAREARALARLNHPGIITLYEFGRADGLYYFLMEYVDGMNLRDLLMRGRISPHEALAIVPQICDALQFAHDQGIVHRDIKPENILLDRRGRVKVADFGLAKLMAAEKALAVETGIPFPSPDLTGAGKIMGTPSYMAPEQKEHPDAVDHRADIYALGVVFYQLLTGELPGQEIEVPSSKVQIDVRLDEVVLRALAKQPELRFQQVSEVKTMVATIVAMNPALAPAPAPSSPPTLDPNPKHMKTKNLQSIVMFILIAVLGVSLAYEMIQRHRLSQRLAQPQTQPGANDLQQARREKFMQAMAQDRKRYSDAQIREAEQLYQIANKKWGAPEAIESLKTMIKKYPDLDRTGCGALYLAQMSQGDERARYLQDCLEKYNDCFYGDGVQVGAYARFLLVQDYRSQGEAQKAEALSAEIKTKYAGAIDHDGNLLKDGLKTGSN